MPIQEKALSLKEENVGYNYVTINGEEFKVAIGSGTQRPINSKTTIEQHQFTLAKYNEYGDKIEVAVHGKICLATKVNGGVLPT